MPSPASTSPQRLQLRRTNQACDACKLRKVKCNGESRCPQCSHLNLRCVYSTPKPRQRSLKRGQLIAKYKQSTNGATDEGLQQRQTSDLEASQPQKSSAIASPLPELPSGSTSQTVLQHPSYFRGLLPDYEVSVYPVNPILTVAEVEASIDEMHHDKEARAFVYAYTALTINLTRCGPDAAPDTLSQVEFWSTEAARTHGIMMFHEKATVRRIMTAQFLHICLMGLRNRDMAFYYLRESLTMIQMLRVDEPEVMQPLSLQERTRRQRLYWEAFVHERYLAIAEYRPIVLPPLPTLPEHDTSLPPGVHEGFMQIIKLFSLIDGEFVNNWLGSHTGSTTVTSSWVEHKQKQIDTENAGSDQEVSQLTDMQQADLVITKHWLRTLVWQMAMSKCLLSSAASKESMSLLFPVRLSKQLRTLVTKMSRRSIEIHGSGIQQKLFELTDTIANVVTTVPAATVEETAGRVDDFVFLVNFLFSLPRFDAMQKEILQKKLERLQGLFPYSANTPDSTTLPTSAMEEGATVENGPWLGVIKTGNHSLNHLGNHWSPESPVSQTPEPPARMWQDMTRKLSLVPSAYHGQSLQSFDAQ